MRRHGEHALQPWRFFGVERVFWTLNAFGANSVGHENLAADDRGTG